MGYELSSQYEIGHAELDAQHRVLAGLVGDLQAAIEAGRAQAVLGKILDRLIGYVQSHFEYEERWFEANRLLTLPTHREEHMRLAEEVLELRAQLEAGALTAGTPLLRLLVGWLTEHIQIRDRHAVALIERRRQSYFLVS